MFRCSGTTYNIGVDKNLYLQRILNAPVWPVGVTTETLNVKVRAADNPGVPGIESCHIFDMEH